MAAGLSMLWTNSLTGNPNFLFFQCFAFYIFVIILLTESIREFIKCHTEKI